MVEFIYMCSMSALLITLQLSHQQSNSSHIQCSTSSPLCLLPVWWSKITWCHSYSITIMVSRSFSKLAQTTCTPHKNCVYLNAVFHGKGTGHVRPITWFPCSQNLTPSILVSATSWRMWFTFYWYLQSSLSCSSASERSEYSQLQYPAVKMRRN